MIMTKPRITMFWMLDVKYATIKHSYGDTPLQQDIRRGGDDEDGDDNDKTMLGFLIPLCSLLPCAPLQQNICRGEEDEDGDSDDDDQTIFLTPWYSVFPCFGCGWTKVSNKVTLKKYFRPLTGTLELCTWSLVASTPSCFPSSSTASSSSSMSSP